MPTLQGIAPIVPVTDAAAAVAFFCQKLGFERRNASDDGHWALVARGEAGLMFVTGGPDYDPGNAACQTSAYVWVEGLDAYWDEVSPELAGLPPGRVRAPFNQAYGMREFHVAWEAFLVLFGEEIRAP